MKIRKIDAHRYGRKEKEKNIRQRRQKEKFQNAVVEVPDIPQ